MHLLVLVRMRREADSGSGAGFSGFNGAISGWCVADERVQQMFGGVSDVMNRAIERFLVRLRRLGETAQLADKLKRRCADLVFSGWREEIMKGLDVSTHGELIDFGTEKVSASMEILAYASQSSTT
jgi:hypothetical protein